jgi:hypothetical protein
MAIRNVGGGESLSIFERSWQTYHQLVAHDLIHQAQGRPSGHAARDLGAPPAPPRRQQ